jgi:hypothetical protein
VGVQLVAELDLASCLLGFLLFGSPYSLHRVLHPRRPLLLAHYPAFPLELLAPCFLQLAGRVLYWHGQSAISNQVRRPAASGQIFQFLNCLTLLGV